MDDELPEVELTPARAVVVDREEHVVNNIIVVDVDPEGNSEFTLELFDVVIVPDDSEVGIGWTYTNGEFSPPVENPPEE